MCLCQDRRVQPQHRYSPHQLCGHCQQILCLHQDRWVGHHHREYSGDILPLHQDRWVLHHHQRDRPHRVLGCGLASHPTGSSRHQSATSQAVSRLFANDKFLTAYFSIQSLRWPFVLVNSQLNPSLTQKKHWARSQRCCQHSHPCLNVCVHCLHRWHRMEHRLPTSMTSNEAQVACIENIVYSRQVSFDVVTTLWSSHQEGVRSSKNQSSNLHLQTLQTWAKLNQIGFCIVPKLPAGTTVKKKNQTR